MTQRQSRLRTTKMTEYKQRSLSEKPVRGWWLLLSDTPNQRNFKFYLSLTKHHVWYEPILAVEEEKKKILKHKPIRHAHACTNLRSTKCYL